MRLLLLLHRLVGQVYGFNCHLWELLYACRPPGEASKRLRACIVVLGEDSTPAESGHVILSIAVNVPSIDDISWRLHRCQDHSTESDVVLLVRLHSDCKIANRCAC